MARDRAGDTEDEDRLCYVRDRDEEDEDVDDMELVAVRGGGSGGVLMSKRENNKKSFWRGWVCDVGGAAFEAAGAHT